MVAIGLIRRNVSLETNRRHT